MNLRSRASLITAAVVTSGSLLAIPAHAAPNPLCDDTRAVSREVANEPDMTESTRSMTSKWDGSDAQLVAGVEVSGVEDYQADVVLRYSPSRQCAYGLMTLNREWHVGYLQEINGPAVWLDTSFDEGQTISLGLVNERVVGSGNSSTYTASFSTARYTSEPFSIRACGRGVHTHTGISAKSNLKGRVGPVLQTEIHSNEVVCTEWVTNRN